MRAIVIAMLLAALAGGAQLRYDDPSDPDRVLDTLGEVVLVEFAIPPSPEVAITLDSITVRVNSISRTLVFCYVFNQPSPGCVRSREDYTAYLYPQQVEPGDSLVTFPAGCVIPPDNGSNVQVVLVMGNVWAAKFVMDSAAVAPPHSYHHVGGWGWNWAPTGGDLRVWLDYNGTMSLTPATWGSIKSEFN